MNLKTQYKFNKLSLQRLAMIKVAIHLWEMPDVQVKLREHLKTVNSENIAPWSIEFNKEFKEWPVLTRAVFKQLEQMVLPASIKRELASIIIEIGIEICTWYVYIRHDDCGTHDDPLGYIKTLRWTYYGTVDVVRTLKTFLTDIRNVRIERIYQMACENMMEDTVGEILNKMPAVIKDIFLFRLNNTAYRGISSYLTKYWRCHKDKNFSELNEQFRTNQHFANRFNYSINENMLKLAMKEGCYQAMKYFWNKLNQNERDRNIKNHALTAIENSVIYRNDFIKFNRYGQILMFLINQMTLDQRGKFFRDHFFDCLRLMFTWPWQEFIVSFIDEGWAYCSKKNNFNNFLAVIVENMYHMDRLGCPTDSNKYRSIFYHVHENMPFCMRTLSRSKEDAKWVHRLYELWDLPILKLLFINLKYTARDRLFFHGSAKFKSLVEEDKLDVLIEFKEEVLSEEDMTNLKNQFITTYLEKKNNKDNNIVIDRERVKSILDSLLNLHNNTEKEND